MSGENWTPGPWYEIEGTPFIHSYWNGRHVPIGQVIRPEWHEDKNCASKEAFANAQLMAAAPDLYEALEGLHGAVESGDEIADWHLVKARKALKKARGEDK